MTALLTIIASACLCYTLAWLMINNPILGLVLTIGLACLYIAEFHKK